MHSKGSRHDNKITRCPLRVHETSSKSSRDVLKELKRCPPRVHDMSSKSSKDVLQEFTRYRLKIQEMTKSSRNVLRYFKWDVLHEFMRCLQLHKMSSTSSWAVYNFTRCPPWVYEMFTTSNDVLQDFTRLLYGLMRCPARCFYYCIFDRRCISIQKFPSFDVQDVHHKWDEMFLIMCSWRAVRCEMFIADISLWDKTRCFSRNVLNVIYFTMLGRSSASITVFVCLYICVHGGILYISSFCVNRHFHLSLLRILLFILK